MIQLICMSSSWLRIAKGKSVQTTPTYQITVSSRHSYKSEMLTRPTNLVKITSRILWPVLITYRLTLEVCPMPDLEQAHLVALRTSASSMEKVSVR